MMTEDTPLYTHLAAAYIRGKLADSPLAAAHQPLFSQSLHTLSEAELAALIVLGYAADLRLHRFKQTMGLARVHKVLGLLRSLAPDSLLDVGSGRGAFLWPLLDAFPNLPVTTIEMLDYRAADIAAVVAGGVATLTSIHGDVTNLPWEDHVFDVVTMLEVLEHIPETARALTEVCRVARRFVVLSVPSKADNNPEHIHLFSASALETFLQTAGATRVSFQYVPGHIIAVAKV